MSYYFNERDRELLKNITEEELYVLCCKLMNIATEAKRCIIRMSLGKNFTSQMVKLAETAALEVARREDYNFEQYNFGITYDTAEFRQWLVKHQGVTAREEFFNTFSFAEILKEQ